MNAGQRSKRWHHWLAVMLLAAVVSACGGSPAPPAAAPSSASVAENPTTAPAEPAAPAPASATFRMPGITIEPAQGEGGSVIHGTFEPDSLSPIDSYWHPVLEVIYGGLVDLHPDSFEPAPSLATSWEPNADYTIWTVQLREGVTWHDGQPFTADDVKYTYDMLINPDGPSGDVGYMGPVLSETVVVDRYTVEFRLKGTTIDFVPVYLSDYRIAPAHILRDVAPADLATHPHFTGDDPAAVIGTGPFRFQERGDGFIRTVRYDDYWEGRPILDEIIFRMVESPTAAETQLQSGEIDIYNDLDSAALRKFENSDIVTSLMPSGSLRHIALNLDPAKTTLFQDVRVRQALFHAIDREAIGIAAEDGIPRVPAGIAPPGSTVYNPEGVSVRYDYDPERAGVLLDEAGWALGADGVRAKDGQRLAFTLHIPADDISRQIMGEALQEYWRAVGAEVSVVPEDGTALDERLYENRNFEAVLDTLWTAPYSPNQFYFLGCADAGADTNATSYCNSAVDELFLQSIRELDPEQRKALYTQAENLVMTDVPIIPINFSTEVYGHNARVRNYTTSVSGIFNAHTWWVQE